jgi:hypothetical protein
MAFYRLGNMIIKLIEPQSDSIFSRHLSKYGEGVHHIKMEVDNYEKKFKYLLAKGVNTLYSGNYMDKIRFSYLDTNNHLNFTTLISEKDVKNESLSNIIFHP